MILQYRCLARSNASIGAAFLLVRAAGVSYALVDLWNTARTVHNWRTLSWSPGYAFSTFTDVARLALFDFLTFIYALTLLTIENEAADAHSSLNATFFSSMCCPWDWREKCRQRQAHDDSYYGQLKAMHCRRPSPLQLVLNLNLLRVYFSLVQSKLHPCTN
jgi:hypothetical protein